MTTTDFAFALSAIALALSASSPAKASPLSGTWVESNGSGAARIGPCPGKPELVCATGLVRRQGVAPAQWASTRLVLTDVAANGNGRWRGTYRHGNQLLPATLRMRDRNSVEMRVCIFVLCQTARYQRVEAAAR